MDNRIIIGITMGDPASIGPEITVKALRDKELYSKCKPIIIGDASVMERAIELLNYDMTVNRVDNVKNAMFVPGVIMFMI